MSSSEGSSFKNVQELFKKLKVEKGPFSEEYLECIIKLIPDIHHATDQRDNCQLEALIECFRSLRGRLGFRGADTLSWEPLLTNVDRIINFIGWFVCDVDITTNDVGTVEDNAETHPATILTRIMIQFLGNAVTSKNTSEIFREHLWRGGEGTKLFLKLLGHSDSKIHQYGSMVIYNCVLQDLDIRNGIIHTSELVQSILDALDWLEAEIEWVKLTVQNLLAEEETFVGTCWSHLTELNRMKLLDIAEEMVYSWNPTGIGFVNNNSPLVHERNASVVASIFSNEISRVITAWPAEDDELKLVSKTLDFLCVATSLDGQFRSIRDDENVFNAALVMLQVSSQRKDGLEELKKLNKVAAKWADFILDEPPWFNFRSRLVRLLANFCYKHPTNQKLIRERDGIQLILNCCASLDMNNFIIKECCIFAIRNLTDGCPENRRFLESLEFKGFASEEDRIDFERAYAAMIKKKKEKPPKPEKHWSAFQPVQKPSEPDEDWSAFQSLL